MRILQLIILLIVGLQFSTIAQTVLLNIPDSGRTVYDFVPKDYVFIDSAFGDLNKDKIDDIVIALKHKDEDTFEMDEEPKRILLVILRSKGVLKVIGRSENVLMCRNCGGVFGDPFASIDITKGVLSIHHYGGSSWRWANTQKFRYQRSGVFLIGSTTDSFWILSDCNGNGVGDAGRKYRDVNFVTGDEEIIERTEECKLIKHTRQKIKKEPLVKLEAYNFEEEL